MAMMDVFSGMPLEFLREQLRQQEKYREQLLADESVLKADLEGFVCEGYEHFKEVVLKKEKKRLAFFRFTMQADDRYLHERIQGQFNEVELLEHGKEQIEQDLAILKIKISEVTDKVRKMQEKLTSKLNKEK